LVPQPAVERLAGGVLPRAARLDGQRLRPSTGQPPLDRLGDELRAVVAADVLGHAPYLEEGLQRRYHTLGGQAPLHLDRQAFPRRLVAHRQELEPPPVGRLVHHEVVAPDVVGSLGPSPSAAVRARTQATTLPLHLRHLQPLATPEPVDPLEVDRPPLPPP